MLTVHCSGMTDRGQHRTHNEDQFLIAELTRALNIYGSSLSHPETLFGDQRGQLFVVADGMGGHVAGEQASALALVTIEQFMLNTLKWFFRLRGERVLNEFQRAVQEADARVFQAVEREPDLRGMGTTLTMAYATGGVLYIAHAGDSRCYLLRTHKLHQLTRDHTLTQELIAAGHLHPHDLSHNPFRHVVTNAIGGSEPGVKVEVHKIELAPDDALLLCSDGLTSMVSDGELTQILVEHTAPEDACRALVARANAAGGNDNITAIVARFERTAAHQPRVNGHVSRRLSDQSISK